jgi:putative transposase
MAIGFDTYAWRRDLPHLQKESKTYFVTFCTRDRVELRPRDRDIALATIVRDHSVGYWLHCCVVMPDHVHLVFTLYEHENLAAAMQRLKSVSSHDIGRHRKWQREYHDRILRSSEDLRRKCEYTLMNHVRAVLDDSVDDYRSIWRAWIEGCLAPARAPAPH